MTSHYKRVSASIIATSVACLLNMPMASAIVIEDNLEPDTLATSLFANGSGLEILSASLSGGTFDGYGGYGGVESFNLASIVTDVLNEAPIGQAGTFTNASGTYGIPQGIVLSTGNVLDYQDGENTSDSQSGGPGTFATEDQNALLTPLTGELQHFDPVQLSITFNVDQATTISFLSVFGSEEFPEFVDSDFTDGFGMFINGNNVAGALPTGAAPGDPLLPINIDHPDFADIRGTELNGVLAPNGSPLLRFDVPVQAGENTFTLILADAGDSGYDTTVFLSSFGEAGDSPFIPILPDPSNPTNDAGEFVFELPEVQPNETIWIDPDIATGYTYTTDGLFASVTAPPLGAVNDPDGYLLSFMSGGILQEFALGANEEFLFAGFDPINQFTITGIDLGLGLDPTNPAAFVTGVSFVNGGQFTVTQAPITTFVPDSIPEPATLMLFGLGLSALAGRRRFTK